MVAVRRARGWPQVWRMRGAGCARWRSGAPRAVRGAPLLRPGASARLRIDRSTFGPTMGPKVEGLGRILAAWRPEVGPHRSSTGPRPRPLYRAVREAPCRHARGWRPARASRSGRSSADGAARRGWPGASARLRIDRSTFGPTMGSKVEGLGRILAAWRPEVGPRRSSTGPATPTPLPSRPRSAGISTARARDAPCAGTPPRAGRPRRGTPPARDAHGTGRPDPKNRRRQPRARRPRAYSTASIAHSSAAAPA